MYSSITQHTALPSTVPATTTPRPTPTTPVVVSSRTSSGGGTSQTGTTFTPAFADFRAPPAALSGSNELCYAAIWDYTGDCDYKGTVFFPKSTCSGAACSLSAATPIMCFDSIWCGVPGINMPTSVVCDNGFRQLTTGSTLSQVVASGASSTSRYYVSLELRATRVKEHSSDRSRATAMGLQTALCRHVCPKAVRELLPIGDELDA